MVIGKNSLATKIDFRVINLDTATRLFNGSNVKSETYGMIIHPQITELRRQIIRNMQTVYFTNDGRE